MKLQQQEGDCFDLNISLPDCFTFMPASDILAVNTWQLVASVGFSYKINPISPEAKFIANSTFYEIFNY